MSRVREAHDRLAPFLRDRAKLTSIRSSARRVAHWLHFAQTYCAAAVALEEIADAHMLPRIQLYGHSVECAFKAFLVAKEQVLPRGTAGHDLVNLAAIAEKQGCYVTELQAVAVVQLSSLYFRDIASETLYKARYPSKHSESRANLVGDFDNIHELVVSICSQCST
jgi:hypothetical protein